MNDNGPQRHGPVAQGCSRIAGGSAKPAGHCLSEGRKRGANPCAEMRTTTLGGILETAVFGRVAQLIASAANKVCD